MKSSLFRCVLIIGVCLSLTNIALAQESRESANDLNALKRTMAIKVGANYSLMPALKSFSVSNNVGFFVGGYFAPPSTSRISFRSELLLSRQGYDYASSRQTGHVMLTYIMLPQMTTIRLTRFLELQVGGQVALLLNANVDSTADVSSGSNPERANEYFSRLNYGVAAGFEFVPFKASFIGARYNLFFDMWKGNTTGGIPPYVPNYSGNLKTGLLQLYLGFRL